MNSSIPLVRIILVLICLLFSTSFATQQLSGGLTPLNIAIGILSGAALAGLMIIGDNYFKRFSLKAFNICTLGLFFGYLMSTALILVLGAVLGDALSSESYIPLRYGIYLVTTYLGLVMTLRGVDELHLSIPFVQFKQANHKKKDILVDVSILSDPRIIDLAASGLLNHQLIIPRFALNELYSLSEESDEGIKSKARRALEVAKKLESIPMLDLRYVDTDFPELKDPMAKLIRLARFLDTNIITSDINRIQSSSVEGVRIINIHMLSNALKPITQTGELINIKIQRFGKEPRQGVGYLDDGTMVVINGGAEFIGETIRAQVLSVKHTSSGRMIFCNTVDAGEIHSNGNSDYISTNPQFPQEPALTL